MKFWECKNFLDAVGEVTMKSLHGFTYCPFDRVFMKIAGTKFDIVTLASFNFDRKTVSEHAINQALLPYESMFEKKILANLCVGAYVLDATDEISIDINVRVHRSNRAISMQFAFRNNQVAIWDCLRSAEVLVGGTGKSVLSAIPDIFDAAQALTNGQEYVFPGTAPAPRTCKWRKIIEPQELPYQYVDQDLNVLGECDHCFSGASFGDNWWKCGDQSGRFPTLRQCRNHVEELVGAK